MQRSLVRQIVAVAGAAVALGASAPAAHAQDAVFSGTVSSIAGPLGGASVGIPELGVGSITGIDGRYSFTLDVGRTAGRSVTMVVRYIGYKPKRMAVTLVAGRVDKDFELERDVLSLERGVTGVPTPPRSRRQPSRLVVDNSAIRMRRSVTGCCLAGKVARASVVSTSGRPGAPTIRQLGHRSPVDRTLVIVTARSPTASRTSTPRH
jgi:hypothetical protein